MRYDESKLTGTASRLQLAKTKKATPRLNAIFCVMSYIKVRNLLCSARNHKLSTFLSRHFTNTFYHFMKDLTSILIVHCAIGSAWNKNINLKNIKNHWQPSYTSLEFTLSWKAFLKGIWTLIMRLLNCCVHCLSIIICLLQIIDTTRGALIIRM